MDMEIDECLVNSEGEANLDEFCDLEPILDEILFYDQQLFTPIDALNSQSKQLSNYSSWSSYVNGPQEIIRTKASSSSSSQLISFGNSKQTDEKFHRILPMDSSISSKILSTKETSGKNKLYDAALEMGAKRVCTVIRSPLQAQDHVMAERKRRKKLSQLFIDLSKVIPGLKKLDKASLLEDATKYVQELQERVRILEEKAEEANKNSIPKSSFANYSATINDDTSSSSKESSNGSTRESVPAEINARISNKNVLIKICSKKQKGLISRIQYEMEKLHLNVLDIRAMPFGSSSVDITILAEAESEFCGTVKDMFEHLEIAFLNPGT
ncbi:unnamed protein product [Fraxinus pennsylvanica]|uniref:BHLH domain-containing protein n=1 Tax=Fraxinus pennsylvanica TaxID=56036 RepID=A0AAD2DKZ6_9LAMI|nr:unnamed protein product [Fraxinus pennsylvanica]